MLTRQSLSSDLSDSSELFTSSDHATDSISSLGSQQVPRLQFECGCGQCTVYSFIAGETCPNPKAFPFPKLEVSGIPPKNIEHIEMELLDQSKQMYKWFYALVKDTFTNMSLKFVDLKDVIDTLKFLLKPKCFFPQVTSQALDCLDGLKSFMDIGLYLNDRQYCSWFDYELIEDLRNEYLFPKTSSEHDSVLEEYKAKFKMYVSHRCFNNLHDDRNDQIDVNCKIDLQYEKLSQKVIKRLKYKFTKILGSPNYFLCFKQAREGCTELIFGAPPCFGEIRQLSKSQKSQLKAHGFLKVTIMERDLLKVDPEEVRLKDSGIREYY